MINKENVLSAFNCLKSYAYYENLNFYLKAEVAKFENTTFDRKIKKIVDFFNNKDDVVFQGWLDKIKVEVLPKKIKSHLNTKQNDGALFLSNNKSANEYIVESVNYLVVAPIEIYLIETLWSIYVGTYLDDDFSECSYGNRVSGVVKKYAKSYPSSEIISSVNIFQKYIDNYNKWRDGGINKAIDVVEKDKSDVAILSLDLKGFYYNIDINFDEIKEIILETHPEEIIELSLFLNEKISAMHDAYKDTIAPYFTHSHPESISKGIPIGFTSSAILANWYLSKFDEDIKLKINPAYYGRYVDDILFVFSSPNLSFSEKGVEVINFIKNTLGDFIHRDSSSESIFSLSDEYHSLPIQKDKLIFHFFDKNHSLAGLRVFKQEIENRSSAFRFLPDEHMESDLDKFAYDVLLNGSANKFRSIMGLAENETELSKYISSHILAHRLCNISSSENTLKQITMFFKGENCIRFSRLWEKVLAYTLITRKYSFSLSFYKYIKDSINKIKWNGDSDELSTKLTQAMNEYADISLCLNLALLDLDIILDEDSVTDDKNLLKIKTLVNNDDEKQKLINKFRNSNMIRHNLVSWPLINYTNYRGDLTEEELYKKISCDDISIDKNKKARTPRFIHADEYQLFYLVGALKNKKLHKFTLSNEYHKNSSSIINNKKRNTVEIKVNDSFSAKDGRVKVALANMKIDEHSIQSACRKDQAPNLSYNRQKGLYHILNSANKEEVDVLLLPELSIPVSWLPFMAAYSRRKQIALIFGLEHWVVDDIAYNILVEMLPYNTNDKYKSSMLVFRVKNYYAPKEIELINTLRLKIGAPKIKKQRYHLVKWRNISFATYNCFELANIEHRSLFKSKIDIMFACVWNKDVSYYQHITESAARDLHCYVAQSNTSHYGGSCVIQPSKSAISNKIYVKGGENHCILTTTLDIKALREAQYRAFRTDYDVIKHNPPGFDYDALLERNEK
ncbi:reverse transcriptase domain-containing protein [Pectobacterium aquaticum]|uniref:Reverse transcriptase n=1 Tax=Pectobacterium aquaticum TaxID=2204145 RepID=A0A3R8PZW3_9GAMM|nr:reverse transcriptase domain-containing protein [Pectobacterium aquaticum]RRO09901.1 reverse transcriptase [Pectobacterium aquaticum]